MTTKTTIHERVLEAAYNNGYITGHNDGAITVYEETMDELEV